MSDERTVKVNVLGRSIYGSLVDGEEYEDNLTGVIEWLNDILQQIPEEHRDDVTIHVESEAGYEGEHHAEIEIYYWRAETDQERKIREHEEGFRRSLQELEERATFERLKRKYQWCNFFHDW